MTRSGKPSLLALIFLISFGSVGAVIYTPALPEIADYFQVSVGQAQNTVTYFFLGFALGQLPYGPLANYLGRKPTIYIGCAVAILGTVFCILSQPLHLFWVFNLGRAVMAFGAAVGLVSSFILIADTMDQTEARKTISYASFAFAGVPGVAILLGGFLTVHFGWTASFYFYIAYTLFIFWLGTRLPKTGPKPFVHSIRPVAIAKRYWEQASDLTVLLGGITMGAGTATVYLFAAKAPFIGIRLIGLKPDGYGVWMLVPTFGALCGALFSAYLSPRRSFSFAIWTGITTMTLAALTALIAFLLGAINPLFLFVPMAFIFGGMLTAWSAISASITTRASDKSNASAFIGFCNLAIPTLMISIGALVAQNQPQLLPLLQTLLIGVMILATLITRKLPAKAGHQ